MATTRLAILFCSFFLSTSISYATCDASIPGHDENRFENHFNGTVTDHRTGLMWSACLMGMLWNSSNVCVGPPTEDEEEVRVNSLTWQESLLKIREINNTGGYSGYTDWRMPNIKEIASIMEPACLDDGNNLAIDTDHFKLRSISTEFSQAAEYWSSTPHRKVQTTETDNTITNQAWKLGIRWGNFGALPSPITSKAYTRMVRGTSP